MFQNSFKSLCFNLFIRSTVVIMALFGLRAYSQDFTFGLDRFHIVDNTKKVLLPNGSFVANGNTYTLTGQSVRNQSIAMWHKDEINLAESFVFDFKLFFGANFTTTHLPGEGFSFVLHNKKSANRDSLIGHGICYLGYAYYTGGSQVVLYYPDGVYGDTTSFTSPSLIDSSFGIMFCSNRWGEYNPNTLWGGCPINNIKYIKDAQYYPQMFDSAYLNLKPLQNDKYSRIASNQWFCGRIYWRKSIENGQTVYDMLTYFEEKFDSEFIGQLLLRDSARFYSVGELITGLTMDSDNRAMVTFGITSVSGNYPNEHAIEFVSLYNGADLITTRSDTIKIELWAHSFGWEPPIIKPGDEFQYGTWHPVFEHEYDPILTCAGYISGGINDTLLFNIKCPHLYMSTYENYYFRLSNELVGAQMYILTDSGFVETGGYENRNGYNYFLVDLYEVLGGNYSERNLEDMLIYKERLLKLVYNGAEYYIKLTVDILSDLIVEVKPKLKTSPTYANMGSMIVKDGEEITITLPELEDEIWWCNYHIKYNADHFTDSIPALFKGGELTFSLAEGICSSEIRIFKNCLCPSNFILHLYNQDSLIPPDITVIGNCAGGAILTANDVNNCAGLKMRWVDEDGNVIDRTSENSNSAKVDSAGRFRAEYYYPSDPKNPIYSADTTIVATDLFTSIFDSVYTEIQRLGLTEWQCYFRAKIKILLPDANASKYKYNVLVGNENEEGGLEWEDAKWGADISFNKKDSSYYLYIHERIDCGTREFKINVLENDEPLCTLHLIADCECDNCDVLRYLFALQYDEIQTQRQADAGKKAPFYEMLCGVETITNLDSCVFRIRIPKSAEIIGITREGSPFPHNAFIRNELDTVSNTGEYFDFFQYTMFPPCDSVLPNPNMKPTRRELFYITYKNPAGEICDSLRLDLRCKCDDLKGKFYVTMREPFLFGSPGSGGYDVDYCKENYTTSTPPTTTLINSYIYDNFGNRIATVYTLESGSTPCGSFSFVMPVGYPSGIYHITLESDEEVLGDTTFFYTK